MQALLTLLFSYRTSFLEQLGAEKENEQQCLLLNLNEFWIGNGVLGRFQPNTPVTRLLHSPVCIFQAKASRFYASIPGLFSINTPVKRWLFNSRNCRLVCKKVMFICAYTAALLKKMLPVNHNLVPRAIVPLVIHHSQRFFPCRNLTLGTASALGAT